MKNNVASVGTLAVFFGGAALLGDKFPIAFGMAAAIGMLWVWARAS